MFHNVGFFVLPNSEYVNDRYIFACIQEKKAVKFFRDEDKARKWLEELVINWLKILHKFFNYIPGGWYVMSTKQTGMY